jgi:hypothetical protein
MEAQPGPLLRRLIVALLVTLISILLWQAYGVWLFAGGANGD